MIQFGAGKSVAGNDIHFMILDEQEIQTLKSKDGLLTVAVYKVNPDLHIEIVLGYTPETERLQEAMNGRGRISIQEVLGIIEQAKLTTVDQKIKVTPMEPGEKVPIRRFGKRR